VTKSWFSIQAFAFHKCNLHRYSSDGVEQEAASSDDDDGEDEFNSTWARGLRRKKMISAIQEGGENRIRMVGAVQTS
jgi:hypothetical protein